MKPKRVVSISDFHAGHRVGLTPPKFNAKAHNYIRASRPPLSGGALGNCDACKNFELCNVYITMERK